MKYLLALEASTRVASVALAGVPETGDNVAGVRGGGLTVLAEFTTDVRKTHSQRLLPMVDRVLAEAGLRPADLGAVACTTGPGSFTGLRIGLATAKGLAFALNIPAFGVPTLDALANNLGILEPGAPAIAADLVCPVLDARKGQVYAAVYLLRPAIDQARTDVRRAAVAGELVGAGAFEGGIRSEGPWAVAPEELVGKLIALASGEGAITGDSMEPFRWPARDLVFLGDGTAPSTDAWPLIEKAFGPRALLAAPWLRYPRASSVAALAAQKWLAGRGGGAAGSGGVTGGGLDELQPVYLRPSEAEVMLAKKRELVP